MRINLENGEYAIWNGSHTINYYTFTGHNYDVSSLYPSDGRKPTRVEVLSCVVRRIQEECQHTYADDCGRTCHHLVCPDCGISMETPDVYKVDTELSLCGDCIWTDAYGHVPDGYAGDALPMSRLRGWLISPNETDHICEGHFGYGCDGCDTRLGGTRYCYVGREA